IDTASCAKCSCSAPSIATWPVIGPSKPIDAAHDLELEAVLLAAALVELLLLLLLLLLPQAATNNAQPAIAATIMRPFTTDLLLGGNRFVSCRLHRRGPGERRRAVGVVGGGRRAGGAKHRDDAHHVGARVLQTVDG